jgi:arabinofuranan 3-O-arabinosyltransferase
MGVAASQTWFRLGTVVATGDNFPIGFFHPSRTLDAGRWLWGYSVTPTGSPDYNEALQTLPARVGQALSLLGIGAGGAQRLFVTALFAAIAPAMYLLLRTVFPEPSQRLGAFLGSLFYAFNPSLFFFALYDVFLLDLALLPLLIALVIRGARSGKWRYPVAFAGTSILLSYAFLSPPAFLLLAIAAALAVLVGVFEQGRGGLRFCLRAMPLVILFNLWWVVPAGLVLGRAHQQLDRSQIDPLARPWIYERSSVGNVLRLVPFWTWPNSASFPYAHVVEQQPFVALSYVAAAATALSVLAARGRSRYVALAIAMLGVVLILLTKGLHPPFSSLNLALYEHVPGMWLYREPSTKFTILLAGIFAFGLATFVGALAARRRLRMAATSVIVFAVAVTTYPLWTGQVIPGRRQGGFPDAHIRIPRYWLDAGSFLSQRPGETLVLPVDDFYQLPYVWGYYGTDVIPKELLGARVVASPTPGGTVLRPDVDAARVLDELRTEAMSRSWDDLARTARALGIRWVLVRRDVDDRFRGRAIMDPISISRDLDRSSSFRHRRRFGLLDLFELRSPRATVWASAQVFKAAEPVPVGLPVGGDVAVVWSTSHIAVTERIERARWRVSANGLIAAIPAAPGAYTTFVRWPRGVPASLTISHGRSRSVARLTAPTVTLDGRPVSPVVAPVEVVLRGVGLDKVLAVGDQLLRVPRAARESRLSLTLPPLPQRVAWYAAEGPASVEVLGAALWGPASRCDSETAAPAPSTAALSRTRRVGKGVFLVLSARTRSACVRRTLPKFRGARVLRLTFDYLRESGAPPRICVWQVGPELCVPLPPLRSTRGRHTFDALFRTAPGTKSLRLSLYADGGFGASTVRYGSIRVTSYRPASPSALFGRRVSSWLGQNAQLVDSRHLLRVGGLGAARLLFATSFETGSWGPPEDCGGGRIDSASGLSAKRVELGSTGRFALAVSGRGRLACVHRLIPGVDSNGTYGMSLDARRAAGALPAICLWETGLGRCIKLRALEGASGWHQFNFVFRPDAGAGPIELFLYADGRAGSTVALYTRLRVKRLPPRPDAAIASETSRLAPPRIALHVANPTRYVVDVAARTHRSLFVLADTFDSGWKLRGLRGSAHVRANGFANGWLVPPGGPVRLTIVYAPQRWLDLARTISWGSIVATVIVGVAVFVRGRFRRTPRARIFATRGESFE